MADFEGQALHWQRDEPRIYSDFAGRAQVSEILQQCRKEQEGEVHVLDAGCGEGYFSRKLANLGFHVTGIEIAKGMIQLAQKRERQQPQNIRYLQGDVTNLPFVPDSFDLCIVNYVTNYLDSNRLSLFYGEVARVLKPQGRFIFAMPHPVFHLRNEYGEAGYFVGVEDYDYFSSRGQWYDGIAKTVNGESVSIGVYHHTLEDHFTTLSDAGLVVTDLREPLFPRDVAEQHPVFKEIGGKVAGLVLTGRKEIHHP